MWLKRATAQNIVIGGAAGAFPPMIGEAAVTGSVGLETAVLALIIFLWTPPHFWALALVRSSDYARAGIPMLPNVAGPDATRRQILGYTLVLVPCGLAPALLGFAGPLYGAVAALAGLAMIGACGARLRPPPRRGGHAGGAAALRLLDPLSLRAVRGAPGRARAGRRRLAGIVDVMAQRQDERIVLTPQEMRRRRQRNIALALVLGALVLLFYVVTCGQARQQRPQSAAVKAHP